VKNENTANAFVSFLVWIVIIILAAVVGWGCYHICPTLSAWARGRGLVLTYLPFAGMLVFGIFAGMMPVLIANRFNVKRNRLVGVLCAIMMGAPVTVKQAMAVEMYAISPNVSHIEGGNVWEFLLYVITPGILMIAIGFGTSFTKGSNSFYEHY
jgi:hypothetical protein